MALPANFGFRALFIIDSLSLILFAVVILGIVDQLPVASNIAIQTLFVASTVMSTILFLSRRVLSMVLLKISMLVSIYILDAAVYFI